MLHIGTEAALADQHRFLVLGVGAEGADAGHLAGDQVDRAIDADRQHVVVLVHGTEQRSHADIGTKPANAHLDRFMGFRVNPHRLWQRQQCQRLFQGELVAIDASWQRCSLWLDLLVFRRLTLLDVQAIGAAPNGDLVAGFRILAKHALAIFQRVAALPRTIDGEAPGVFALRVIGTADEAAHPAQFEAETAVAAGGAFPGIGAIFPRREEVRTEILVQRVYHVADLQILGLIDGGRELIPERVHHRAPVDGARRYLVELFLQRGGEAGVDVMFEEAHEERGDQTAPVLRHETALLQPHIFPVLQDREDGGVGGGPADPELFHLLDEAGFRVAGRRLGEMLVGIRLLPLQRVLGGHRRQHPVVLVIRRVVGVFAVELEEPIERDDRTSGPQRLTGPVDDVHGHLIELRRLHLRRDGALPDQLVQPPLVWVQIAGDLLRRAGHVGRADRLVRFLRVLGAAGVFARRRRQVVGAKGPAHVIADAIDRFPRHLHAVGPHIGDQAGGLTPDIDTLIQTLREPHRLLRAKPELA